jgi:hypothetical protein
MPPLSLHSLCPELVREVCLHIYLPEAFRNDPCHLPHRAVSYSARFLPSISLISRAWRKPVQELMVQYLYLNSHKKLLRFADHLVDQVLSDPSFADKPLAIKAFYFTDGTLDKDSPEGGYISYALIQILRTCQQLRFVSIPIANRLLWPFFFLCSRQSSSSPDAPPQLRVSNTTVQDSRSTQRLFRGLTSPRLEQTPFIHIGRADIWRDTHPPVTRCQRFGCRSRSGAGKCGQLRTTSAEVVSKGADNAQTSFHTRAAKRKPR